tara:strand:+ start:207 stop:1172 length:966 start_codon:yes stop_codon:yes gene_type:complete
LICGASNQDLLSISDLCAVYATLGVHCIDVAADPAVVHAAREALDWVEERQGTRPWLMVSVSDGKDAHFRKAWFDPQKCPPDCSRPCEKICPVKAISSFGAVDSRLCYGCGRCISSCPLGIIDEKDRTIGIQDFAELLSQLSPDAIEIHTAPGRLEAFKMTLNELLKAKVPFNRISVSCGLEGYEINYEDLAKEFMDRYLYLKRFDQLPLWQLDGRKMCGDLGQGTAKFAVSLWQNIRHLMPPGPLQLAGGTNNETIKYFSNNEGPSGIAFGGMARKIIQPWLLEAQSRQISLKDWPEGWNKSLNKAGQLVMPWLSRQYPK